MSAAAALVPDLLRHAARESPEHVALVVDRGESLTYGGWDSRSNAAARGLAAAEIRKGDRVGLFFDNERWTDYAVCYLATHKAGAAAVPLSPRFTARELTPVLEHAGIEILICPDELAGLLPVLARTRVLSPQELESGREGEDYQAAAAADDLAEIIYTSGTTARPKGVACSHANIVAHDLPPAPPGEASFLHAFPVGTNAGQECLRMPLRRRTTAVVLPSFDPEQLCEVVAQRRIRRLQLAPAMARVLVDSDAAGRCDFSSVDRVTLSSAPAPAGLWPRLQALFPDAILFNAYALTESGGARTLMRYDPDRPHSVGRPVGESELRIADEAGNELAPGETGEVWLRRRGAPRREYYRDEAATAAAYAGDWLRTGDLGFLDGDGYLQLVGRRDDMIISGGFNVSALEVEEVLYEHPAVLEAAVFGVPHDVLGEQLAAAVVVREPVSARELQAFVRAARGEHKVPHRVVFVDSLPRNATGKVLKRELRERFGMLPDVTTSAGPRNDAEATVLAVWQEVLERSDIGVQDDFFDLGGHSLAAAQIVARLRDSLGAEVPVTAVFDHPTVAELAAAVSSAADVASSS